MLAPSTCEIGRNGRERTLWEYGRKLAATCSDVHNRLKKLLMQYVR